LESDGNKIIAEFDLFIKDQGFSLPAIPKVKIQTEPSLIRIDRPNNTVIVPYWDDLTNDQKEIFKSWRDENAEELFVLMFNWFFIPHELGHFINPMIHDLNPYQCEREANEVAVMFFRRNPENFEKLDFLKKSLTQVLEILPKIDCDPKGDEDGYIGNPAREIAVNSAAKNFLYMLVYTHRLKFRHQAMDSIDLVFCRSGERKVADAFIAMLLALGDGSRLRFQLPGDELFECRHAVLLLASLVRQASEISKVFGHSFDNGLVGCEVRLVAGDEIAPMAAFSGAESIFD
jgi:hypothetical protein